MVLPVKNFNAIGQQDARHESLLVVGVEGVPDESHLPSSAPAAPAGPASYTRDARCLSASDPGHDPVILLR